MARGKKTSKLTTIIFILFIAYVLIEKTDFFINHNPAQNLPDENITAANQTEAHDPSSYAMLTSINNWPQITANNIPFIQSADLLSDNYYLVLDASGSMEKAKCSGNQTKMDVAFNALDGFIKSLPQKANFGLAVFHKSKLRELVPLGKNTDRSNIVFSIRHKIHPNGSTPLADAISFAYNKMNLQAARQLGYGEHHLVLITDGIADDDQNPVAIIRQITRDSPVIITIIGFCISNSNSLKQPGRTVYYSANDPASLTQGLQNVLAESAEFNVLDFSQ